MRTARRAWNLLHIDSQQARRLAERAIASATSDQDPAAEGWARIALGYHLLYFGTVAEASRELQRALRCFDRASDRAGQLLASAALSRAMWRAGRVREALDAVLPLREEGVRVLRHEQRGVLLNTIAGCYSALGDSSQAFAHMFEALRDAGPKRGHGFDTVLHCNLSHELLQIGDYDHALQHVDQGLAGCARLKNARLLGILLINRVLCLTELGRASEAMPDVAAVLAMPTDASGRGSIEPAFETMAIAALRAGDMALGGELVERALAGGATPIPDERVERVTAAALLSLRRGDAAGAVRTLRAANTEAARDDVEGLSVRIRAQFFNVLSEAHEAAGDAAAALAALRQAQRPARAQSQLASRARYQAAALQTELLRLQHRLDENDARRRRTERARAELAAINAQLSRKIEEVQSLQEALRQQAVRDALTGLYNRRHLGETLPALVALARREDAPLSLVIIDLDHFKRVNDVHGHAAGDRLLAAFGQLLSQQVRRSDVACRYGGEEFCLLMPRTAADAARRKVQQLLRRWRAMRFELDDDEVLEGLSFSAGVADTLHAPASPDALLKAADDELLAAKREGRNRVIVALRPDSSATAGCRPMRA
ncbi:GGDEF domain-containing protein [Piscinibacter aquaticus]|uniref:diguanylate cyclase n=1 Tax=Piscinibacter aquaticus TaxID=392597 RepID=A0A5C6U0Y8_9BURK|nr:GGDEF domain-containing protein [Piscinibacter aquaticus]